MENTHSVLEEREHREFSPSRSERFILCPGSNNLLKRTPNRVRTPFAMQGDIAHAVLEAGLTTFARNAESAIQNSIFFAEDFNIEFRAAINEALNYVWALLEDINSKFGDAVLYTETFVNPPVASAPGEAGGYCDIVIYSARARWLWVADYKHGEGVVKDAVENSQIMQYGAGFLYGDQPSRVINPADIDGITLVIIQPRAFHIRGPIREYTVTPARLFDYLMELESYIEASLAPDAPLIPGLDQCRFCEARSVCPALEARALATFNPQVATIKQVNQTILPDPRTLDIDRLSYIKQSFDLLKVWMNGVDSHIDELVRGGQVVPGYKMVEDYAKRQWSGDEAEQIKKLAALIGCAESELYETKRKPVTTVEVMVKEAFKDRVGRGRKKAAAEDAKQMFAWFTNKVSSGNLVLVKEDDPRPAINKALQVFGQLEGINFNSTNQGEQQ